jgi:dienelactone hydrolase
MRRSLFAPWLFCLLACSRGETRATEPPVQRAASGQEGPAEALPTATPIVSEELTYSAGETSFRGFLARPAEASAAARRPGVLVVHEWWGLNEYVRKRTRMLAELGYVALAVDMFGGGRSTEHPAEAKKFTSEVMSSASEGARRFDAARTALLARPEVNGEKLAAIGYCFGGAVVLGAARRGSDLDLVASFHGSYATQTPMQKGTFGGKLFIAHGAADSFASPEQVATVKQELDAAGADYEFVAYDGAKHGFTNPEATETAKRTGLDVAYDAEADSRSWSKLRELLAQAL